MDVSVASLDLQQLDAGINNESSKAEVHIRAIARVL